MLHFFDDGTTTSACCVKPLKLAVQVQIYAIISRIQNNAFCRMMFVYKSIDLFLHYNGYIVCSCFKLPLAMTKLEFIILCESTTYLRGDPIYF